MKPPLNQRFQPSAAAHPPGGTGLRPVVLGVAPKTVARREITFVPTLHPHCLFADESRRDADFDRRDACATPRSITNRQSVAAFTMMEIAVCLAIIGFALVAIIGVLPYGMHTQRDNREETIISQDASVLLETIRNGARSQYTADLTNYVYAITNDWTLFKADGSVDHSGVNGYTQPTAALNGAPLPSYMTPCYMLLTNDANIIGLLSTPEFVDNNGKAAVSPIGIVAVSNHITAYVRSLSGLAVEKPPQNNLIMREDTFSYQIICVNASTAFYIPPLWQPQAYNIDDYVTYILNGEQSYWLAVGSPPQSTDVPASSSRWSRMMYPQQFSDNLRELRLRFRWPLQPNGQVGNGSQNFRVTVGGQLTTNRISDSAGNRLLYSYQPQSFIPTP